MTHRSALFAVTLGLLALATAARAEGAPSAVPAASAASSAVPRSPEQRCADLWHAYDRSARCYARYRTVHGIKEEAAKRCGPPLKEPSRECPRN